MDPVRFDSNTGLVRLYLLSYNLFSLASWSYLLYRLYDHLSSPSASFTFQSFFPGHREHQALIARAHTSYADFGEETRLIQTTAVLEIIHVATGLVRSNLQTTVAQVASRLVLVWGILLQFPIVSQSLQHIHSRRVIAETVAPQTQSSPIFSSMVFAWSVAEIVRYATYALALYGIKIYPLEWLRCVSCIVPTMLMDRGEVDISYLITVIADTPSSISSTH